MLLLPLVLALLAQDTPPTAAEQKQLIEAYFKADGRTPAGREGRGKILARLDSVPLTKAQADAQAKAVLKRWEQGRELEKDKGQAFFWEEQERGLFIVGGEVKKPKGLVICMHGGGVGQGNAWSAHGSYDRAIQDLGWLAVYPQVLEKTETGWTTSGTEEFVIDLLDAARRTWKIDPDRIFLAGHSMGGYGSWTLGAHHADRFAGLAPSAGGPTPILGGSGRVVDIVEGIIPNLRNVALRIYQSDDDPQVPPDVNRAAVQRLEDARQRWGGYDYEYWEVTGQGHGEPPGGYSAHLAKLAELERTTHPEIMTWQPVLDWTTQSYWLYWEKPVKSALVVARADRAKNEVYVECSADATGLQVLLDPHLLALGREVVVFLNKQEVFRGVPRFSLATIVSTGARGDPELLYTARAPLR